MGISGNTVRDLNARWDTDVVALKPDWVCVLIGINDVWRQFDSPNQHEQHVPLDEYERTYDALITRTLKFARGMVLMTPYYMRGPQPQRSHARTDGSLRRGRQVARAAPRADLRRSASCMG